MKDKLFNFRVSDAWLRARRERMRQVRPDAKSFTAYLMEMIELGESVAPILEKEVESDGK